MECDGNGSSLGRDNTTFRFASSRYHRYCLDVACEISSVGEWMPSGLKEQQDATIAAFACTLLPLVPPDRTLEKDPGGPTSK